MITFADQIPDNNGNHNFRKLKRVHEIESYKMLNKMTFDEMDEMLAKD